MRYAEFRGQELFVGPGVVARPAVKPSSANALCNPEWIVRGANASIALRCVMKSNRREDYSESRVA
jgi:hypothetical protein